MTRQLVKDVIMLGTGGHVPKRVITNADWVDIFKPIYPDTTEEWIRKRTGIERRHFVAHDEHTSDMALAAIRECLERTGVDPKAIDVLVVPTVTPDTVFPSTAHWIHGELKLSTNPMQLFDIRVGCTAFLTALDSVTQSIRTGRTRLALVVGADKMSIVYDMRDRKSCVLAGDGAACVLLQGVDPNLNPNRFGIKDFCARGDGAYADKLWQPIGGAKCPVTHDTVMSRKRYLDMEGGDVYNAAIKWMYESVIEILAKVGVDLQEVDWVIGHQANARILQAIRRKLKIPEEKMYINIHEYGNTTAATIPLCLNDLDKAGKLKTGDKIVMVAFGTGYDARACFMVWGGADMYIRTH